MQRQRGDNETIQHYHETTGKTFVVAEHTALGNDSIVYAKGEATGVRYEVIEDTTFVGVLSGLDSLTPDEIKDVYERSFAKMVSQCKNYQVQGSTACIASAWLDEKNKLHTSSANLGDSAALRIIINRKKNTFEIERINKNLHNPSTPSEIERLKKEDKPISIDANGTRIGGSRGLAVSRAIGDEYFVEHGLSHRPEIDMEERQIKSDEEVFLLMCCDGLTEADVLEVREIAEIILREAQESKIENNNLLLQIVTKLITAAFEGENKSVASTDNISVVVLRILRGNPVVTAGMFDGHGGSEVSKILEKGFYDCLKKEVSKTVIPRRHS